MRTLQLVLTLGALSSGAYAQGVLDKGGDLAVTIHEGKAHVFYVSADRSAVKHIFWDARWRSAPDVKLLPGAGWFPDLGTTFTGDVRLVAASVPNKGGQMISLITVALGGGTHPQKTNYATRQFHVFKDRVVEQREWLCHNLGLGLSNGDYRGLTVYQGAKTAHFQCLRTNVVHDYYWAKKDGAPDYYWMYVDPNRFANEAAGPGAGWALGSSDHYVYRNTEGNLLEYVASNTIYNVKNNNLSEQAGKAKQAVGDPVGYAVGNTQHVVYEAKDRAIHELWWDGSWHFTDVTKEAAAPANINGALAAHVLGNSQHVFYRTIDQHIRELYWTPEQKWKNRDIWAGARGRVLASNRKIVTYLLGNTQHVLYIGADGNIHELWEDNAVWKTNNITAEAARP